MAVLDHLGMRLEDAGKAIETLMHSERAQTQPMTPTSGVKRVIELAFQEARWMGQDRVGSEHLLLGVLLEGDPIARKVLLDRGITAESVRATVAKLNGSDQGWLAASVPRHGVPQSASLERIMQRAIRLAADDMAPRVDDGHVLNAVLMSDGRAALTLRHLGVDTDALIRLLHAPRLLVELREQLRDHEGDTAQQHQAMEALRDSVQRAERAWLDSLSDEPT